MVIAGRREEVLAAAVGEIGPAALYVVGDVPVPDGAARMVQSVLDRHGRLDVLVNNAGGQYFVPAEAIEPKGWSAVTRVNRGGTELMSRAAYELAIRLITLDKRFGPWPPPWLLGEQGTVPTEERRPRA